MVDIVQYEWDGAPYSSESVKKVNGVEVSRNLMLDPRLLTGVIGTTRTLLEPVQRGSLFPELGDRIGDTVMRFGALDADSISVYARSYQQTTFYPGMWYAGSIWVHTVEGLQDPNRFNMQFISPTHPSWSSRVAQIYPSGMKRIEIVGQVDFETNTRWVFWPYHLKDYPSSFVYLGGAVLSGPAGTRNQALNMVREYFDGDTPGYERSIMWDTPAQRIFESGVDRGVLYPNTGPGVPWNGLVGVTSRSDGGEAKSEYFDGVKINHRISSEEVVLTIEAFTYPDEFAECIGELDVLDGVRTGENPRSQFSFSYRTGVGNSLVGLDYGYKLHLVYDAMAVGGGTSYVSYADTPEASTFSWEVTTKKRHLTGYLPLSTLTLTLTPETAGAINAIESILYGTSSTSPRMPTPAEVLTIFENYVGTFTITDYGDGSFSADGSSDTVYLTGETTFGLDSPSVDYVGPTVYDAQSL